MIESEQLGAGSLGRIGVQGAQGEHACLGLRMSPDAPRQPVIALYS